MTILKKGIDQENVNELYEVYTKQVKACGGDDAPPMTLEQFTVIINKADSLIIDILGLVQPDKGNTTTYPAQICCAYLVSELMLAYSTEHSKFLRAIRKAMETIVKVSKIFGEKQ